MKLVTNEVELIKNCISNNIYPTDIGLKRFINMLIGYFYKYTDMEKDGNVFRDEIINLLNGINNLDKIYYQEYKYAGYIKKQSDKVLKGKMDVNLKEINSVNITKKEMDIIHSANTEQERKVLFAIYVLAKINADVTGWVNYSNKVIFDLANVRITNIKKLECIHSLYVQGLIKINMIIDKHGYKVKLGDDTDDIEMVITDFDNLGNQYLNKYKDGWKMCEYCKKMFRVKSKMDYSSKYCKKCGEDVNREKTKERMKKLRNL